MVSNSRRPNPRKKPSVMALRRLDRVLADPNIGLALRGTSWQEGLNRKRGVSSENSAPIYAWQAPAPEGIRNSRDLIARLRATLLTASNIALYSRNLVGWRKWKTPNDYPAIIILKNRHNNNHELNWASRGNFYRAGYEHAKPSDYNYRNSVSSLEGFQAGYHFSIPSKDVLAVVRPTKKEMREIETKLLKITGLSLSDERFFTHFWDAYRKLMVNKTARSIAKGFQRELEKTTSR